jgi:hypothetical protein
MLGHHEDPVWITNDKRPSQLEYQRTTDLDTFRLRAQMNGGMVNTTALERSRSRPPDEPEPKRMSTRLGNRFLSFGETAVMLEAVLTTPGGLQ